MTEQTEFQRERERVFVIQLRSGDRLTVTEASLRAALDRVGNPTEWEVVA